MDIVAGAIAATVACGLLAGCGGPAPDEPAASVTTSLNAYEATRAEGAQRLLDTLAETLVSGDVAALDTLIDPAASAGFRDDLRTQALNLGQAAEPGPRGDRVRLKSLVYRIGPQNGPEWRIPAELQATLDEQGSSDFWVTPVETVYALGGAALPGLDEPDVTRSGMFTLARYGDDWKLVGYGDLGSDPHSGGAPRRPDNPAPWDFPGLKAKDVPTAGGTSVVLSYPGTEGTVRKVSDRLPAAVGAVDDFWGDDWRRRAAVIVTGSTGDFAELTRTESADVTVAAAATIYASTDPAGRVVTGQRIVFAPGAAQLSPAALAVVLRHELFHVAARLDTAGDAPLWLTEGVAEYVGRYQASEDFTDAAPELAAEIAAGDVPERLPTDAEFSVASEQARVAYQSAWSFAAFIADKYGRDKLREVYLAVARGGSTATTDAALSATLGVAAPRLISDWQKWLRTRLDED